MDFKNCHTPKSGCPIAHALDIIGDKWTLLVLREIIFMNQHEFGDFLEMDEAIATNILTDRLKKLQSYGVIDSIPHPDNKKKKLYYVTKKGIDFIPTIVEIILWSSRNSGQSYECGRMDFFTQHPEETKKQIKDQIIQWNSENIKKS